VLEVFTVGTIPASAPMPTMTIVLMPFQRISASSCVL
jgi:hypothetical protein